MYGPPSVRVQILGVPTRPLLRSFALALLGRLVGFCFQRGDTRFQLLIFLARQASHLLDRLELLALHHVEVAQNALGLTAEQSVELAPYSLRHRCRQASRPAADPAEVITGSSST